MTKATNKWIDQIVDKQQANGSWGSFHSLSTPTKGCHITTEQALRRLYILGLTHEDRPVKKSIQYMRDVLSHRICPPDRREKAINWDYFEQMMMAAWIKRFIPNDGQAQDISLFWGNIVKKVVADGAIHLDAYEAVYRSHVPKLHEQERPIGISQLYMVTLLGGTLDKKTEDVLVNYLINNTTGIYYIYGNRIADVPTVFQSLNASRYLGALECLSGYGCASDKLAFAVDWILSNKDEDGWDMGVTVRDGIYFPISDSWRKPENRQKDCTERINKLLKLMSR